MGKRLFIAEKPSVAREFAKALHTPMSNRKGYLESEGEVVTWCVGHLVTMSYPEAYDPALKRWTLSALPFIPDTFQYEVIPSAREQFATVSTLLNRKDVDLIYVCTDSGREGEYIYRLVEQEARVTGKERRRVWIDSQTEEEILRGIREAKDLSAYDSLAAAAYLRAKEDYLMGINFSRLLTLKYSNTLKRYLHRDRVVISVGRVMTCVLGMVVSREREIRAFQKTPFYRIEGTFKTRRGTEDFNAQWRAVEGSPYYGSPLLYKENGFKRREDAQALIDALRNDPALSPVVEKVERKKELKRPPFLYNLAELQNDCSKYYKMSPDETLQVAQELYEKKLTTYPRTDARVLSTAVAKEIDKNLKGLTGYAPLAPYAKKILGGPGSMPSPDSDKRDQAISGAASSFPDWRKLSSTRYVNDKQITDHYAIIPTGQGYPSLRSLSVRSLKVYELIARRFLSIFYPPAVYQRVSLSIRARDEHFFSGFRGLLEEGYLEVSASTGAKTRTKSADASGSAVRGDVDAAETKQAGEGGSRENDTQSGSEGGKEDEQVIDAAFLSRLMTMKKGTPLTLVGLDIKEGETTPPRRYRSGSLILAMENAGQLIEEEELRSQIKGSGIGTSATRAEILKKLVSIEYLALNKKTQVITPTQLGEMISDVVRCSIKSLLNPALTASWEKGLSQVADGVITDQVYWEKLVDYIRKRTDLVRQLHNESQLTAQFDAVASYYRSQGK